MKKLILLALCLCFLSASAQVKLPETKTVDSTDNFSYCKIKGYTILYPQCYKTLPYNYHQPE